MGYELGTDGPSSIVVGVDGTEPSFRAAAYALGQARRQGSRMVAVFARSTTGGMASVMDASGAARTAVLAAQDEIETLLRRAHATDAGEVDVELVIRTGDPYQVLSDVAREVRADCVVVGSSQSIGHRIAGSLAVRLVRRAHWPVTVVP
ncbi:universal stress protein [Cellulomonas denverensis]|uniref:Universal stress protein n=1 Tax=Cellulomonas denverensis TaxID=264297 RepID=A0A7X6QYH8_9CELL|nr:universal stress protein [Cellulomonas denverensis]NKY22165.1 universal stress protein [Cellulomonas denverensis]GIG27370.1 universal stress protein A [Cellulomonas denverensis]